MENMSQEEAKRLSDEYDKSIHFLGRSTSIIALLCMFAVPLTVMLYFGANVHFKDIMVASSGLIAMFIPLCVVEVLSYYTVLGAGGSYVSFITGNVLNLKLPSAISGMKIAQVEPGSREGDVIAILATSVSSLVTIGILILGMLFLSELLKPILEKPILQPGFSNIIPALMGAISIPQLIKGKKLSIAPIILSFIIFLWLGPLQYGMKQSYILIVMMAVSVLCARILFKMNKL